MSLIAKERTLESCSLQASLFAKYPNDTCECVALRFHILDEQKENFFFLLCFVFEIRNFKTCEIKSNKIRGKQRIWRRKKSFYLGYKKDWKIFGEIQGKRNDSKIHIKPNADTHKVPRQVNWKKFNEKKHISFIVNAR